MGISNLWRTGSGHPLIDGLIQELPAFGEEWPLERRAKWFIVAADVFDLLYSGPGKGEMRIRVEVMRQAESDEP